MRTGTIRIESATCITGIYRRGQESIKQTAENYPETEFYKTEDLITQLGIGEAFVTMLNEKGIPTPLVHTMILPPRSRMDILTDSRN